MISIDYVPMLTRESTSYVINATMDALKGLAGKSFHIPPHKLVCRELLYEDWGCEHIEYTSNSAVLEGTVASGIIIAVYGYEVIPDVLQKCQLTLIDFWTKGEKKTRLSLARLYIPEKVIHRPDGESELVYRTTLYLVSPVIFPQGISYKIELFGNTIPQGTTFPMHFLGKVVESWGRTVSP